MSGPEPNAPPTALQLRYGAEHAKHELARIKHEVDLARGIMFEDRDSQPYSEALVEALNALSRAALAAEARAQAAEAFEAARSGA